MSKKYDRLALVVGCSKYEYVTELENSGNDARDISQKLEKLNFKVIKLDDPSQRDLRRKIDEFGRELKDYRMGLFYYAGHGVQVNGHNYLIPVDVDLKSEEEVEYDCVRADRVLMQMEGNGGEVNVLILDACRNNPFAKSWSRALERKGLAPMNPTPGSIIAFSTSPEKTASDGSEGNGLYTHALLQEIDRSNTSILQMFQNTRRTVLQKSNGEQRPWEVTSLTSDLYLIGGPPHQKVPKKVLVAGTGTKAITKQQIWISKLLGKFLGENNFTLITGGWPGIDFHTTEEFSEFVESDRSQNLNKRLYQIIPKNKEPKLNRGNVFYVNPGKDEWIGSLKLADFIILIGGVGGTFTTYKMGLQNGIPVFPIFDTKGDTERIKRELMQNWPAKIYRNIEKDTFFEQLSIQIKDEQDANSIFNSITEMMAKIELGTS